MDVEKSLQELKRAADSTLLKEIVFTSEMERTVKERVMSGRAAPRRNRLLASVIAVASAAAIFLFSLWQPMDSAIDQESSQPGKPPLQFPGAVWETPTLWKPSPPQVGKIGQDRFTYLGEKPVRIIAGEFYENQADKVVWLFNGLQAEEVELVGIHENGQRYYLGDWKLGDPLYDADRHFPSSIALPEPGIWKLQVLVDKKHFGQVYVDVKPGISPANRSLVEPLIRKYVKTNPELAGGLTGFKTEIELLGVKSYDAEQKQVYAWVTVRPDNPLASAGIRAPVKFEIYYVQDTYKVVGHTMPDRGADYWTQVAQIFPEKIVEQIKQRSQQ